jgi:hypothetical protein
MAETISAIQISPKDNVGVCVTPVSAGDTVTVLTHDGSRFALNLRPLTVSGF